MRIKALKIMIICSLMASFFFPTVVLAQTEESDYINGRMYRHASADCAYLKNAPTEMNGAQEGETLYPCPVCMQQSSYDQPVAIYEFGGLLVVAIPDAALREPTLDTTTFYWDGFDYTCGEEANRHLSEYLHGNDYLRLLTALKQGAEAEAPVYELDFAAENCKPLSVRYLGNTTYQVYRREKAGELTCRVFGGLARTQNGVLNVDVTGCYGILELPESRCIPEPPELIERNGLTMELYHLADAILLTVNAQSMEFEYNNPFIEDAAFYEHTLLIGGLPVNSGNVIKGGCGGEFVTVITASEYEQIIGGADVGLFCGIYSIMDFEGTQFATYINGYSSEHRGIVNDKGETLRSDTSDIWRLDDKFFIETHAEEGQKAGLELYDASHDSTVRFFESDRIWLADANSAICLIDDIANKRYIVIRRDKPFGETIAIRTKSELEDKTCRYRVGFMIEDGEPKCFAMDTLGRGWRLYGNDLLPLSDFYYSLNPLIWHGNKGLIAVFKDTDFSITDPEVVYEGKTIEVGGMGQAGLMDENGNLITDIRYRSIQVISDTTVILIDSDGNELTITIE